MAGNLRVIVNGASGKMGTMVCEGIEKSSDLDLCGRTGRQDDLGAKIRSSGAQVVVDFSHPEGVFETARLALESGACVVVGTTGLTEPQMKELDSLAKEKALGIVLAPNFSLGAVLMDRFAAEAARYLPQVEIIEYHHDEKADSPSGTALNTARNILKAVDGVKGPKVESRELLSTTSRGASVGNIRIHGVRLPGFIASQEVIFGAEGQTLKIRHDTLDRSCFLPGILLAIRKVSQFKGLVLGLDQLL